MFAKNTKFCALFVSRSCAPDIIYTLFARFVSVAAHNTLCAHYTLSIKHTYMGGTVLFILFYFIWGGVGGVWNGAQISFRFALYLLNARNRSRQLKEINTQIIVPNSNNIKGYGSQSRSRE